MTEKDQKQYTLRLNETELAEAKYALLEVLNERGQTDPILGQGLFNPRTRKESNRLFYERNKALVTVVDKMLSSWRVENCQ
jgi:hypothetical protein